MNFIDKDLASIQEARILSENAGVAKKNLLFLNKDKFDKALNIVYRLIDENLFSISKMYIEECAYGNLEDEYKINKLLLDSLYKKLLSEDVWNIEDKTTLSVSIGGVLLIPSPKNSLLNILSTILLCLKTGNVLVIATDRRSIHTTNKIVSIISEGLIEYPLDFISCFLNVSDEGIKELIHLKTLSVIINAGNKRFLDDCKSSGKIFYYGSTGASPVFIERSANVKKAVEDIVKSRSFNNGILPGAEQFLVVDEPVAEEVIHNLKIHKAYFMKEEEEVKLIRYLIKDKIMDEEKIGKSAYNLALESGFAIPKETSLLVSCRDYISELSSYTKEINSPLIVMYKENDWLNACEKCMRLLTREHDGHSLSIYSNDKEVIKQFITKKPVGRILVNTNTSFSAMGISSNAYPSSILGAFTRGLGVLSGNLKAEHLIYKREVISLEDDLEKQYILEEDDDISKEVLEKFLKLFSDIKDR